MVTSDYWPLAAERIRIGVSACLLGQNVRYDGQHKLDHFVRDTLGRFVELVPVCPEVEAGFGVPREPMRLTGDPAAPRLMTTSTGRDMTERMLTWAQRRVEELVQDDLCGFIFKSKSPSSGMARVKVYPEKGGQAAHTGVGLFARAFMDRFPLIPVEEEGRLNDLPLRENFIERVFTLCRFRAALAKPGRAGALVDFHTRHKLLIRAHSPALMREMGALVARAGELDETELTQAYEPLLTKALKLLPTRKKHVDVLMHILGYFKHHLNHDEKEEFLELLGAYGKGLVPLIVPVTMAVHFTRKHGQPYLQSQLYLRPHPLELQLRNHS